MWPRVVGIEQGDGIKKYICGICNESTYINIYIYICIASKGGASHDGIM